MKAKANDITKTSVSEETGPKGQKIYTSYSLSQKTTHREIILILAEKSNLPFLCSQLLKITYFWQTDKSPQNKALVLKGQRGGLKLVY